MPEGEDNEELRKLLEKYKDRQDDVRKIPAEFNFHNKVRSWHRADPLEFSAELT
jgi:hypothetical protein